MIPDQIIEIQVKHKKVLSSYKLKGYSFDNNTSLETIKINSKDLPISSRIKVKYNCDECNKSGETFYFTLTSKKKHLCRSCSRKGIEPANKIHLSIPQIDLIEKYYSEEWLSPREIGKYLNYSEPVIHRALIERGHPVGRRGKKPNATCPICKTHFKIIPSQIKEINCCSKKCRGIFTRKRINLMCLVCDKTFQVKPNQANRKFCSLECAYEYRKKGMLTSCMICGKTIWSTPSRPKMFCSNKCFGKASETGKVIDCAFCGSQKYVSKCHLRNELYFCSHKCSIKYRQIDEDYYSRILEKSRNSHLKKWKEDIEWAKHRRKEASITAIKTLKKYNRGTSKIEQKVYDLLKIIDISYVPQKEINSFNYSVKKVYDIYLPKPDIFIEIHGGFWHADPRFYSNIEKLKPVQIKNAINDKIKNDIVVNELHKKLYVLWEHDILTNINEIKNQLIAWNNI